MRRGRDGVRGFGRARGRRCRAARQTGVGSALLLAAVVGLLALAAAASSYVTTPSTIYTIAGNGVQCPTGTDACGDGGIATAAQVFDPLGVALDAVGDLYIADVGDNRIREVTPEGVISTIAGNGHLCAASPDTCGDGESANGPDAELAGPVGVAVGSDGVYIADEDGNAIRFIPSSSGTLYGMSVTAGDIYTISTTPAGRPGAILNDPLAVAVDASGDVYIANTDDDTVLKVTPGDVVSTIAGGGVACPSSTDPCGDGGAATSANLNHPAALALDSAGDVYLADSGDNRIRFIPATGGTFYGQSGLSAGDIYTIAGTGTACSVSPCGDGGSPTSADLSDPTGVAVDNAGNVYIADLADYTVRELTPASVISTIAGDGTACAIAVDGCGDGGAATSAALAPSALAVDGAGNNIFVCDASAERVRWITVPQGGPQGAAGPPGVSGSQGAAGPPGVSGSQGPPGAAGQIITVTGPISGNVITGDLAFGLANLLPANGPSIQNVLTFGVSITFAAPEPGALMIEAGPSLRGVLSRARRARNTDAKSLVVLSGAHTFLSAGSAVVKLKLTAAGKKLLRRAKHVTLVERGTFTPTGGRAITTTHTITLKR